MTPDHQPTVHILNILHILIYVGSKQFKLPIYQFWTFSGCTRKSTEQMTYLFQTDSHEAIWTFSSAVGSPLTPAPVSKSSTFLLPSVFKYLKPHNKQACINTYRFKKKNIYLLKGLVYEEKKIGTDNAAPWKWTYLRFSQCNIRVEFLNLSHKSLEISTNGFCKDIRTKCQQEIRGEKSRDSHKNPQNLYLYTTD